MVLETIVLPITPKVLIIIKIIYFSIPCSFAEIKISSIFICGGGGIPTHAAFDRPNGFQDHPLNALEYPTYHSYYLDISWEPFTFIKDQHLSFSLNLQELIYVSFYSQVPDMLG